MQAVAAVAVAAAVRRLVRSTALLLRVQPVRAQGSRPVAVQIRPGAAAVRIRPAGAGTAVAAAAEAVQGQGTARARPVPAAAVAVAASALG